MPERDSVERVRELAVRELGGRCDKFIAVRIGYFSGNG